MNISQSSLQDTDGYYRGVDSHVHIQQDNSPTGDTWESGSRSAIAGGNTTVIAFASQKRHEDSVWPAVQAYHAKADGNSFCDYGFHVILTNPTEKILSEELAQLVESEGITSVKIYMTCTYSCASPTYRLMRITKANMYQMNR